MNTRRRPTNALLVAAAAGFLAAAALALPVLAEPGQGGGRGGGKVYDRGDRGFDRTFDPNSDEGQKYRDALKAFCVKHSPRRWQEIEDLIRRHGGRATFMRVHQMSMKFRELQKLERDDPTLHALKVQLIEIEDVEYGLITDLQKLDKSDAKTAADLRAQLREQNKRYVDVRLKERNHRLERLAKVVDEEKEKLARDARESDRLVDERLADIEKGGPDFFLPTRYRRGPEGGGPGGGEDPTPPPGPGTTPQPPPGAPAPGK